MSRPVWLTSSLSEEETVIDQFTMELRYLRNVSPKTLELYRYAFQAFAGAMDSRQSIVQRISELKVKPVTINTYIRCLNAYFMWLHKEHGKERIKIPWLKEEEKLLDCLTLNQVNQLIKFRPSMPRLALVHTLCLLLMDTGLRIDEAISLTQEDVNWDALTLRVQGKGNKQRLVPFSQELRKMLFRYVSASKTSGVIHPSPTLLFTTKNNTKFSQRNLLRQFHKIGKLLSFRLHPHMLRHVFAITYLKNGGNLEYLRRILGHSSILTTQKYLRSLGVSDLQAVHSQFSPLSNRGGQ